jgi:membrane-bound lytic murein transglycosylase B
MAQALAGDIVLAVQAGEAGALSVAQVKVLQQSLNELGFDAGTPDGLLGPHTQSAIRRYQVVHELPADGYPGPSLLTHVEHAHAAAAAAGTLLREPGPTFAGPESQP